MACRLGWVLYWTCLALIPAWVLIVPLFVAMPTNFASVLFLLIPALVLYGIGRAFRYVLAGD